METKKILQKLSDYKYPLLVLLVGVLLMLLPGGIRSPTAGEEQDCAFAALVERIDGVGECSLALSDTGVVVVCEGAEEPAVRLALLQAILAYTGFTSERIAILKLAEHDRGGRT